MPVRSTVRSTIRPTLRTIGNSSPIGSGGVWLLADGTWNDSGVWDDSATWLDSGGGASVVLDDDAATFIAAVEAADNFLMRPAVKSAVNAFFVGLKTDGNWDSIGMAYVWGVARTLAGASVPIKGPNPTATNCEYVAGVGMSSPTGSFDTNYQHSTDAQNDAHLAIWVQTADTSQTGRYAGAGVADTGTSSFTHNVDGTLRIRSRSSTSNNQAAGTNASTGFMGISRSAGASYTLRFGGDDYAITQASQTPFSGDVFAFRGSASDVSSSNGILRWISAGAAIDLSALDSRLTTLFDAVTVASVAVAEKVVIDDTFTDCDSLAIGDINGSGKIDIVTGQASGASKALYWFKQNASSWTRYTIDTAAGGLTSGDLEGAEFLELAGKPLVLGADQDNGNINIYTPSTAGNPEGSWTRADLLDGRPWMMNLWAYDIDNDGEDEIIFTWEGTNASTGGINWLDFTGTDPMDPSDWTEHVLTQHPGAFWIARSPVDISGSGRGDLVFSARNEPGRNPDHEQGVFWAARPAVVTDPWTVTTIDNREGDWHKCEVGNFFGDSGGRDVIAGDVDGTRGLVGYSFAASYATPTEIVATKPIWNIRKIPSSYGIGANGRDAFLVAMANSYVYVCRWSGTAWQIIPVATYPTQGHPLDNIIEFLQFDGDNCAVFADSSDTDSKLALLKFLA